MPSEVDEGSLSPSSASGPQSWFLRPTGPPCQPSRLSPNLFLLDPASTSCTSSLDDPPSLWGCRPGVLIFFLAVPLSLWVLSPPARDRTHALYSRGSES